MIEHVEPIRATSRYWYMWKLPLFGERDPQVIRSEVEACIQANPTHHVRLIGFDPRRQTQVVAFVVSRGVPGDLFSEPCPALLASAHNRPPRSGCPVRRGRSSHRLGRDRDGGRRFTVNSTGDGDQNGDRSGRLGFKPSVPGTLGDLIRSLLALQNPHKLPDCSSGRSTSSEGVDLQIPSSEATSQDARGLVRRLWTRQKGLITRRPGIQILPPPQKAVADLGRSSRERAGLC